MGERRGNEVHVAGIELEELEDPARLRIEAAHGLHDSLRPTSSPAAELDDLLGTVVAFDEGGRLPGESRDETLDTLCASRSRRGPFCDDDWRGGPREAIETGF